MSLSSPSDAPFKLYRVTIERTIYVLAPHATEAEYVATSHERDELCNEPDSIDALEVIHLSRVPSQDRDFIPYVPYGHPTENRTVEEILGARNPL